MPKPTALKLLAGNPGKRPLNKREPKPPPGAPDPPEGMSEAERSVWDQLVPRLAEIGLASTIDGRVLSRYCHFYVLWRRAADFVSENGTTFTIRAESKREGQPGRVLGVREWPQAGESRKLHQILLVIEREFGLTPAARTRIQLEKSMTATETDDDRKRRAFFAQQGQAVKPGRHAEGG